MSDNVIFFLFSIKKTISPIPRGKQISYLRLQHIQLK
jgi:hypothetical protein